MGEFFIYSGRGTVEGWGFPNLIYVGNRGTYFIKKEIRAGYKNYYHLGERLCDPSDLPEVIAERLLERMPMLNTPDNGPLVCRLTTPIGTSRGRIQRPIIGVGTAYSQIDMTTSPHQIADFLSSFLTLISRLETISLSVHLHKDNLKAYGHEIRSLLILSANEVEALFKFVGLYDGERSKANAELFFRISNEARLSEYVFEFGGYPGLGQIRPFSDWEVFEGGAYTPLRWYQGYNKTKHDRSNAFAEGNLWNSVNALLANLALILSLVGKNIGVTSRYYFLFQRVLGHIRVVSWPEFDRSQFYLCVPSRVLKPTKIA